MQGQKEMCATTEDRVLALKKMREGVEVKDRRYHLKTYKQVFVGSEAVDFLVNSGLAASRDEAVRIGLELQHDFNFFSHVVADHLFKDDYLFYRFNDVPECNASDTASELSEDPGGRGQSLKQSNKVGLRAMGDIIRDNIKVHFKFSVDKECFRCDEAVDFLVTSGLASTRLDAVQIGKALENECGFFQNVMERGQKFQDTRLFFSFEGEKSDTWKEELQSVRAAFQSNVKVADHTYHLKVYKDSFTGKDAVDCILALGITTSRRDALLLGRSLMYEYLLFAHVTDAHLLEDTDLFYRFSRGTRESSRNLTSY